MTDRIKGIVVTLLEDQRADDVEAILTAIRQLRGVVSVQPLVANVDHLIAVQQARHNLRERIWRVLEDEYEVSP